MTKWTEEDIREFHEQARLRDEAQMQRLKDNLKPWLAIGITVVIVVLIAMGASWERASYCKSLGLRPGSTACADTY